MVDYLNERYAFQTRERQVQEEDRLLRLENDQLRIAVKNVSSKSKFNAHLVETRSEKKSNELVGRFRQQTQAQTEGLQILKEQYERIQQISMDRVHALEEQAARANKKWQESERRRKLETEGFVRDVEMMKRKARVYDEYMHRVKRLVDQGVIPDAGLVDVEPVKQQVEKFESELDAIISNRVAE